MNRIWQRLLGAVALLGAIGMLRAAEPPPKVAEAVKAAYPAAKITEIERERHRGVTVYEVELRVGGHEVELKIDESGVIGSIETELRVKDAPAAVIVACKKLYPDAKIEEVEQREVRGVFLYTGFALLKEPRVVYEVEVETDKGETEILLDASGKILRSKVDDDDDEGEHEDDD